MKTLRELYELIKIVAFSEVKTDFGTAFTLFAGVFAVGVTIGLVILGWWLFPTEYAPDKLNDVPYATKVIYVKLVSEWYAYTNDPYRVVPYISQMDDLDVVACAMADQTTDFWEKARYTKAAYLANGYGCPE
jgi:hypothetical protein